MFQTAEEKKSFDNVVNTLSSDKGFSEICQEANILYPGDRFEEAGEASQGIENYVVAKLKGGWLMPLWYQWYHSITQAEIDRYIFRTLLRFSKDKQGSSTPLRPGEIALITLISNRDHASILGYLSAFNPIGILLRRVCLGYAFLTIGTSYWFWVLKKQFKELLGRAKANKPADITVVKTNTEYQITYQGQSITSKQLNEAIQKQQETSWWQVFKKMKLKREYPFDIQACNRAWECYWVEREKEKHMLNHNTEHQEPVWSHVKRITIGGAEYETNVLATKLELGIQSAILIRESALEAQTPEDFWGIVSQAMQMRHECWGQYSEVMTDLQAKLSESHGDEAWQKNLQNFSIVIANAEIRWKNALKQETPKREGWPMTADIIESFFNTAKEKSLECRAQTPEAWILKGGVQALEQEYTEIMRAFNRIELLLEKYKKRSIEDSLDLSKFFLAEYFQRMSIEIQNAASEKVVEKTKTRFHRMAIKVACDMRNIYGEMDKGKVNIPVFEEQANTLIQNFIEECNKINPGYIKELAEKKEWFKENLESIRGKCVKQLLQKAVADGEKRLKEYIECFRDKHVNQRQEKASPLPSLPSSSSSPESEEESNPQSVDSGELPMEYREYRFLASRAYEALGVPVGAPPEEVKQAYHKKSLQCHPDKGGVRCQFQELQREYLLLTTSKREDLYEDKRYLSSGFYIKEMQDIEAYPKRMNEYRKEEFIQIAAPLRELLGQVKKDWEKRKEERAEWKEEHAKQREEWKEERAEWKEERAEWKEEHAEWKEEHAKWKEEQEERYKRRVEKEDAFMRSIEERLAKLQAESRTERESEEMEASNNHASPDEMHTAASSERNSLNADSAPPSPLLTFAYKQTEKDVPSSDTVTENKNTVGVN